MERRVREADLTASDRRKWWNQTWWKKLLDVTLPIAVVAVIGFLSQINSGIDRTCQATANLDRGLRAVVRVDNELNEPQNAELRRLILGKRIQC